MGATAHERLDYPTQKPEKVLNWVIRSATKEDDIVLDAFVGSGTTLAVAEKLKRYWIDIDCGKLAIYTAQKRLLNLKQEIGNNGSKIEPKPFTLYNAGLYDFSKLKELFWDSWRFFALQLFQCRDEPHTIGGIKLDGYLKGASVLIFNHMKERGVRIDEETIESLHEALGARIGNRIFIIAPALTFDFQQDYITLGNVRYYALRIPYSIINELHQREFTCLKQPSDEMAVNDTVEAVGFDFIRTPELKFECGIRKGESQDTAYIKIKTFKSEAVVREPMRKKGNLETLSMVMLDYDFDDNLQVFDLDAVFYADALEKADWALNFPIDSLGKKVMAVFIDIYGNEARVVIEPEQFGISSTKKKKGKR
ncbi:MAG: site-specific DNA-methyltransferase [Candidatus Jettenia sp.]|nr:site-specific DNA-methyltransferase [Candidatus Jettenia sp.]